MKTLRENWGSETDLCCFLESALGKQVSPGWAVKVCRNLQPGLLLVFADQAELHFVVTVYMDEAEEFTLDEAVRVLKARIHLEVSNYLKKITYPFAEAVT